MTQYQVAASWINQGLKETGNWPAYSGNGGLFPDNLAKMLAKHPESSLPDVGRKGNKIIYVAMDKNGAASFTMIPGSKGRPA